MECHRGASRHPNDVVAKLAAAWQKAMDAPDVKARHLGRKIDPFCFGNRGDRSAEAGSQ